MASVATKFSRLSLINYRLLQNTGILVRQTNCSRLGGSIYNNRCILPCQTSFQRRSLHVSPSHLGLEEFFDSKETLDKEVVKCGRPWSMDELRIKSNTDLHKLWYILLKERNMLMTMEQEYREQCELLPSPERIHKVEESMENILDIVKERNTAYNLLEKGETGLPGTSEEIDALGRPTIRHHKEYPFPAFMNIIQRRKALLGRWTVPFLRRWRERVNNRRYAAYARKLQHAKELKEAFPDADIEFPEEPVYMKDFQHEEQHASFERRVGHGR